MDEDMNKKQRRVVCAALRRNFRDGSEHMIVGPRHFDATMHDTIQRLWLSSSEMREAEQGFIDQWGAFMSREEAFEVATAAGQIIKKSGNPESKELFSEDIY